jgi:hypothetical protein
MKGNFKRLIVTSILSTGLGQQIDAQVAETTTSAGATAERTTVAPKSLYQKWIQQNGETYKSGFYAENPAHLIVTMVEGDESEDTTRNLPFSKEISFSHIVFADGTTRWFQSGSFGVKGGGNLAARAISSRDLQRIEQFIAQLPDDGSRLPPPGRRLLIQFRGANGIGARVYDRANAPAIILELLRISRSWVPSAVLRFHPVGQWTVNERHDPVALDLAPDKKLIITADEKGPVRYWDADTQQLVHEVPWAQYGSVSRLKVNSTGSLAAVESWGTVSLVDPMTWKHRLELGDRSFRPRTEFSPDGQYLFFRNGQPRPTIIDTKTLQQISAMPGQPKGAADFIMASQGAKAISLSEEDMLALWDVNGQREIAQLDEKVSLQAAAFSPDESLVATATKQEANDRTGRHLTRIRIWRTDTGALVHELRPFEQDNCELVQALIWSHDGQYIIAGIKLDVMTHIGIWSAQSGRFRAHTVSNSSALNGFVLRQDGKLITGSDDGIARVFDTAKTLKEITEFEASVGK